MEGPADVACDGYRAASELLCPFLASLKLGLRSIDAFRVQERTIEMAKAQKRGTKEARKPKKEAPPKPNQSNPSTKGQVKA